MNPEIVSFRSDGVELRGWLYRPEGPGPHPLLVLAHGYSATHAFHYWRTAQAYAQAGMAVLDFDGRNLGLSGGTERQVIRVNEQVDDVRAALAFARTLDGMDPSRVGLYGSSLGGGLAIAAAAGDPELAALVLVMPFIDGLTNLPGTPMSKRLWLMRQCLADRAGRLAGRQRRVVPVFGQPNGRPAVVDRDQCWDAMLEEMHPDGEWLEHGIRYRTADDEYVNEVTAWEVLEQLRFRPGRKLTSVMAPVFMLIGTRDTVTPPGPQRRAGRAANAEIVEMPANHFDVFRQSVAFDQAHAAQLDFVRRIFTLMPA